MPDLLFSHGILCPGEVGLVPRAPTKCSAHSIDTAARLSPVPPPPRPGSPVTKVYVYSALMRSPR